MPNKLTKEILIRFDKYAEAVIDEIDRLNKELLSRWTTPCEIFME